VQLHAPGVVEALGKRDLRLGAKVEVRELLDPLIHLRARDQPRPVGAELREHRRVVDRVAVELGEPREALGQQALVAVAHAPVPLVHARDVDRVVDPVAALHDHAAAAAGLDSVVVEHTVRPRLAEPVEQLA
jgi:hypothetical protein